MLLHRDEHCKASFKGGYPWAIHPQFERVRCYWGHYSPSWGSCDAVSNLYNISVLIFVYAAYLSFVFFQGDFVLDNYF